MSIPPSCVCRECGYEMTKPEKHCTEYKCPECGGEMRRREQPMNNRVNEPIHKDFKKILDNFIKQYGKEKGTEYYYSWLNKHKLDDTKPYSVQTQLGECKGAFCESFRWLDEPLIKYYKEDTTGRYYKCVALTANVSMNMNDYSDQVEFSRATGSLAWRPLNINHDHSKFLPFPENRVDYAVYEDGRAETVIRIDNSRRDIQRKIENGDILHPSIEGNPRTVDFTDTGRKIGKWNFTALALLERDVTLPGDPLTYLEPLPLNESMGRSLVESLSVEKDEDKDMSKPEKETPTEGETLQEGNTGINNMEVCGQCVHYEELSDSTKTSPKATGQPDDAEVTVTKGGFAPGVGVCRLATRLEGVTKYVKKNDPACTDGRVRDTATDVDRTIERKINMSEIEKEAMKNDYESRIAAKEKQLYEETQRTNKEREEKLSALITIRENTNALREKEREIANLTTELTRIKEERLRYREEIDNLNEQVSTLNIGIREKDKDIKHYRDRYDAYERTHKELTNETIMLKEQLSSAIEKRDDLSLRRAEAEQRALNAEQERARIAEENAILMEKLAKLQQEVYDTTRVRADSAKQLIEYNKTVQELREENKKHVDTIRDLKQKISHTPTRIKVKG